jgi:hypothetical protein
MLIHRLLRPPAWPAESVPLARIERDWHGAAVAPPAEFALAVDDDHLWLLARRAAPASTHPHAGAGAFVAGLWRFDVAELFLGRTGDPAYLEVNLAPNGAWWSCEFTAPRRRRHEHDVPLPGVRTHATPSASGGWDAALGVPLAVLRDRIGFDDRSTANVTFVVDAPAARYLCAAPATAGAPDFHAPGLRTPVRIVAPS